jgi:hypothetical protein
VSFPRGIVEGTTATDGKLKIIVKNENDEEVEEAIVGKPDYRTRGVYYKLGAELLDAFPAKKSIEAQVGVEHLLDAAEDTIDYAEFEP